MGFVQEDQDYFVYILQCSDETLYTGITNNLEQRLKLHDLGKASKFTRGRRPVKLLYVEKGYSKGAALSRELQIKKLSKPQKLQLIGQQHR